MGKFPMWNWVAKVPLSHESGTSKLQDNVTISLLKVLSVAYALTVLGVEPLVNTIL